MYKIGDFSSMSKTTIKALRYYEKEGLLKPVFIDPNTGYRFYETSQLIDVSKIVSLRQIGLSIKDIKRVLDGHDMAEILNKRKAEIENSIAGFNIELSKINYLLEGNNMSNEIFTKEIPGYIVYYRDGKLKNFGEIQDFVLKAGADCAKLNPCLRCVNPDYCYVSYLDGEYKEKDFRIRYAQAVESFGLETGDIGFVKTEPVTAVCIYHKGSYGNLRESYNAIIKYIEENNYEIIENARECYIDGCWNKENEDDYLTEIQFPVKKR